MRLQLLLRELVGGVLKCRKIFEFCSSLFVFVFLLSRWFDPSRTLAGNISMLMPEKWGYPTLTDSKKEVADCHKSTKRLVSLTVSGSLAGLSDHQILVSTTLRTFSGAHARRMSCPKPKRCFGPFKYFIGYRIPLGKKASAV